jgi:hypothetical protein
MVRNKLPQVQSDASATVLTYKGLAALERAFRSVRSSTGPHRVRAHVVLCMLAYYLEWHLRRNLPPMLLDEHDPVRRDAQRPRRWPKPRLRRQRGAKLPPNKPTPHTVSHFPYTASALYPPISPP